MTYAIPMQMQRHESGPSLPPDNSAGIEAQRAQAAKEEQARKVEEQRVRKEELLGLRNNATSAGRTSAQNYFSSRGLDPSAYAGDIDTSINSTLSGIAPDDPNPGSYFQDIGARTYMGAEEAARLKASRGIDDIFSPNFETTRVPYTLDDPYLEGIYGEQRQSADDIIRNMLSRGVITQTGYNSAFSDLDRQAPTVRSRLNEIGTGTLASEQQSLRDVANRGRQGAQTVKLGQQFDPGTFGREADDNFSSFINSLSDTLRSKAPGNLFNTGSLSAIAGAGQGAQNLPFNPGALAGEEEDPDDEENRNQQQPVF